MVHVNIYGYMKRYIIAKLRVINEGHYINGSTVVVQPFERNWIKQIVPIDIKKGNYQIGAIADCAFNVCYVGRAIDQPLQTRILQHPEYLDDNHYFCCKAADKDEEAIYQECIDYHSFGEDEWLDNECHPALPEGEECSWVGCGHIGK